MRTPVGRYLYSWAFWLFFGVSCGVMFLLALVVFAVTFPFDRKGRVLHLFSCFWAQLYFYVNPRWQLRIEGRERLPWRGPAVLVSNHQSLGDVLVLFGLYRPFKWVSKKSVFGLPLLGWNMRLNRYVPLVRGQRESVVKMMRDCERWLACGVPVLMFPEGTRSEDGQVKAFKDGAFQLAVKLQCPVIPIALSGTGNTLPKHGLLLDSRADCRVQVLPAIHPHEVSGDVERLREAAKAAIVEALGAGSAQLAA